MTEPSLLHTSAPRAPGPREPAAPPRAAGRSLTLGQGVELVAWKVAQRLRSVLDGHGGYRRLERRSGEWGVEWKRRLDGGLRDWLRRPEAGELWIGTREAAAWARATHTPADQAYADAAVAGVFDLLGSGPVSLGEEPEWRRDLYSGAAWSLDPAHRVQLVRGDGSDIRTVWELGRCYHFTALARAYWATSSTRYRDAFTRHVESWIAQNPVGYGPHWASPMDAAIRAANWSVALVLFADAPGISVAFWQRMLANLHATGHFIARHLEWHPVYRGNHYVSNGVGLVYLGALFRGDPAGERWLRSGARLLEGEIRRQVGPDGVSFEGSLAYHRLVTEMFGFAAEVLRRSRTARPSREYEERLRAMYRFIAAYLPESGEAPMLGDADDGRLHAVSAEGMLAPRRHRLGLPARYWSDGEPRSGAYPQGGFYVLRRGAHHAAVRCGAVGLLGAGCHDHNDQLALELVLAGRRVLADSGTYAYTRDLQARFAHRSTAAHGVVQLGEEEQNPIRPDRPWRVLGERTRSECTAWEVGGEHERFAGRHFGFAHRASRAVCEREVVLGDDGCRIVDRVEGGGIEPVTWRLHFAPGELRLGGVGEDRCTLRLAGEPEIAIDVRFPAGLTPRVGISLASDEYGRRHSRPCLEVSGEAALPLRIAATFTVARPHGST